MRRLLLPLALCLALAAIAVTPARTQDRTLTVFAASSLTGAFNEIGPAFEKAHPQWKVRFNFAASSTLRTQIQQGAPADVFASADYAQMEPLVNAKLVGNPQTMATTRLTIIIPARNPGRVRSVKDLGRRGLRLIATSDNVPIGRYTQQVLDKLSRSVDYGEDFEAKVNDNVVSREANAAALVAKVELGEADAAVVYESDAHLSRKLRSVPIPGRFNVTAQYPIAVVLATEEPKGAESFFKFVRSHRGEQVLRRHGFR